MEKVTSMSVTQWKYWRRHRGDCFIVHSVKELCCTSSIGSIDIYSFEGLEGIVGSIKSSREVYTGTGIGVLVEVCSHIWDICLCADRNSKEREMGSILGIFVELAEECGEGRNRDRDRFIQFVDDKVVGLSIVDMRGLLLFSTSSSTRNGKEYSHRLYILYRYCMAISLSQFEEVGIDIGILLREVVDLSGICSSVGPVERCQLVLSLQRFIPLFSSNLGKDVSAIVFQLLSSSSSSIV